MRTPMSGGKKTPQSKKDAAADAAASGEKTPETAAAATTKATPKSGRGTRAARGTGRRSTPRSAAATPAVPAAVATPIASPATSTPPPDPTTPPAPASLDPKIEQHVEETTSETADAKAASTAKSLVKKVAAKAKSPVFSPAKAAAVKEPTEELEEAKNELDAKTEDPKADADPMKVDEQEKPAVPKKGEEEHKSGTLKMEGKSEKPDVVGNEGAVSVIKKEGESEAVLETESRIEESLMTKEDETAEKVVALEEVIVTEEHGEQQDFETGNEEMPGEGREDEQGVGEEEAGLKEEEQIEMSDMIKERKKKKEQEIFVGGLDRDATEEDLRKVFEKMGVVEDVRLHKDFTTNKNKGFAFVKFAEKEQANRAISELKNLIIRGKRCGIAPSEDNDTLFLGNICNTWTKEAIKRRLKEYGVEGLENITLVEDTQNEGLSRGFAFVEFSCHEYAMNAYKRLQKPDVVFGHAEWSAKVAFAEPLREADAEVMAQVKSVFIDGMPPYWDEDRVKEQFKGYGEIERVVLARNMPTAKRKDFGFVNFTTHEAAVTCVEAVNNTELGDGKSKMKARARLANPLPKTQAVKGGIRGGFRIGHSGVGFFPRFGRGFGRGRLPFTRAGFHGARGFHVRGRGRGGRFSFPPNNIESSRVDFRGRRPFGARGGLRGSFRGYEGMRDEFFPRLDIGRSRHGSVYGGRGRPSQMRREPLALDGDFGGPFDGGHFAEDPYYYGDIGHGMKRPFSMMEHDASYVEPGNRVHPRYDLADPLSNGVRYRDPMRSAGGMYSHDYYGSDYGGSSYSSLYGGEGSGSGYYY